MTNLEILEKFAAFAEYDENQTRFILGSRNYEFNRGIARIKEISEYDPTNTIGVLYAQYLYDSTASEIKIPMIDILKNPHGLDEEIEMYSILHSDEIKAAEQDLTDRIDELVSAIIPIKKIGDRDRTAEKNALISSVPAIVEHLGKCNVDLFLRGGPIRPIHNANQICKDILLYPRLAECLLDLEQKPDGIYLCYIDNYGSADGYFGFYIVSNGTILSVNERVNEAYPGQHKNSRNGRWRESKHYELFPYQIFDFSNPDYLGYYNNHTIDRNRLALFEIGAEAYIPIILAMVMLTNKYANRDLGDLKMRYVDSLLPKNRSLEAGDIHALVVRSDSQIAKVSDDYDIRLTSEEVVSGELASIYNHNGKTDVEWQCSQYATGLVKDNVFVDLYGDGFVLNKDRLLLSNRHLIGRKAGDTVPDCEFIGSKDRMDMIAYVQARRQLAEYIRDRMQKEFEAFGGTAAVKRWYTDAIQKHKDDIFRLCVEKYKLSKAGEEANVFSTGIRDASNNPLNFIGFDEKCNGELPGSVTNQPFNVRHDERGPNRWKVDCPITGAIISIAFRIRPNDWHDLEKMLPGEELPKIVRGWVSEGHFGIGNSLLDATDPITELGTPFEDREIRFYNRRYDYLAGTLGPNAYNKDMPNSVCFDFSVGFSKRGFSKLCKEVQA